MLWIPLLVSFFSLLMIDPTIGQQYVGFVHPVGTWVEDLTQESAEQQVNNSPMTLPFVFEQPSAGIPSSYLRPLLVDFGNRPNFSELGTTSQHQPAVEDLTSPLPSPNVAMTLPFNLNSPPNKKPNSYLRPLLVDFQDDPPADSVVNVDPMKKAPTLQSNENKPAVEDLTSPLPATPQAPNVAVTLPFLLNPPKKPTSFLRPFLVDSTRQNQPAVEDLTSPLPAAPPTAVTLPFVLAPSKLPASYLRPWFADSSDFFTPIRQEQTKAFIPTKNVAVTLPFAAEKKPSSYLRPVWPTTTADAADFAVHQDLTSSISGTVQPSPNVPVMTLPFFFNQPTLQSTEEHGFDVRKPSGAVYQVSPLIASLLADSANQQQKQRPLKHQLHRPWIFYNNQQPVVQNRPTAQEEPWIILAHPGSNQQQQVSQQPGVQLDDQQPVKQTKPWFVPVGEPVIEENGPTGYQMIQPLIAFPISKQQSLTGETQARRPFFSNLLGNGTTQTGNVTLVNGKNKWQTTTSTVYSTTLFTITSIISNAFCFSSSADPLSPTTAPWCSFRRKRSLENKAILTIDGETIEPSQVQKILMTALPSANVGKDDPSPVISSSIEDNVEGRFFVGATKLVTIGQPITTSTITLLTTTILVSITGNPTTITFLEGNCVPLCLQKIPTCQQVQNVG